MKSWYKRLVMLLATAAMMNMAACYGSFGLTKKVYKFNGSLGGPLIKSIVFWALLILPVYEIAFVADFFILNVLEALTGSNPLAQGEKRVIEKDGVTAVLSSPRPGVVVIESQGMIMEANESGAIITDQAGQTVATITTNEDGSATMRANGEVKEIPAGELSHLGVLTQEVLSGAKTERHIIEAASQSVR
jgi:hypothetical protein